MANMVLASAKQLADVDRTRYRLDIVTTLGAISDQEIAPLTTGRSFYVSRPWLSAVERQRGDRTAYIVCRDNDGVLRGACPVYWGKPSSRGYYDPFGHFFHRSGATFNRDDWSPAYAVGSRAAYCCEFLLDTTIEPQQQREVLSLLLEAASAHAVEVDAASVSAMYLNQRGMGQLREVLDPEHGYYLAGANSVLDLHWSSMDEYVEAMGHQSRNIRREMRIFAQQGYAIDGGRLSDWIDVAAHLFAQLEQRYGHTATAAAEAVELRILAECADDHSQILAVRDGKEIIGTVLLFMWDGVVYGRSAGFNYAATKRAFEYFNLAYYETIRFAIEHGYRRLEFGMATYRAKLARGARLEPLWGISASRSAASPLLNERFAAWNDDRCQAVQSQDPSMLEGAQVP
ncbi:GNAT family N-acetyltransferase [Jatrophihabitans sp. DSM 45814]